MKRALLPLLLAPFCLSALEESTSSYNLAFSSGDGNIPHILSHSIPGTDYAFGGWIQFDKNWFLDSPVPVKQYPIRRLRLYATSTTYDLLTLMFMVHYDRNIWDYHYIYADILKPTWAQLRIGLFKKPFGLEALYSSRYFWMVNRSLGTINYLTLRDVGIAAHGLLFNDTVEYGAGVFNGNGSRLSPSHHKLYCGHIVWRPWHNTECGCLFQQLQFGLSGSTCQKFENLANTSFATGSQTPFLTWNGQETRSRPGKFLFGGDIEWLYGSGALRTEFLLADWGKVSNEFISTPFQGYSWYIEGSYILTGEMQPRNKPLFPCTPLALSHLGGAVEVLARFEIFHADQKVVKEKLATGATFVSSTTLGVNYYLNPFVLTRLDWQFSHFNKKVEVKTKFVSHESVITLRLQAEF